MFYFSSLDNYKKNIFIFILYVECTNNDNDNTYNYCNCTIIYIYHETLELTFFHIRQIPKNTVIREEEKV